MLKSSEAVVIVTSRSISANHQQEAAWAHVTQKLESGLNTLWVMATGGFMVIKMVIDIKLVFRQ